MARWYREHGMLIEAQETRQQLAAEVRSAPASAPEALVPAASRERNGRLPARERGEAHPRAGRGARHPAVPDLAPNDYIDLVLQRDTSEAEDGLRVTNVTNFAVGTQHLGVFTGAPQNDLQFLDAIPMMQVDQQAISESVEQVRPTRSTVAQGEGTAAVNTDFNYQEVVVTLRRVSRRGGISDEAMRNGRRLGRVVEVEAPRLLREDLSYIFAHGDGSGDNPRGLANMTGGFFSNHGTAIGSRNRATSSDLAIAHAQFTTQTPTESYNAAVTNIPAMILAIRKASRMRPQWCFADYDLENGIRYAVAAGDDHFLFPPQVQMMAEELRIGGIPIVPTNEFPARAANSVVAIMGRSDVLEGYWYGDVEFETTNSDGTDFQNYTHAWRVGVYAGLICRMPETLALMTVS